MVMTDIHTGWPKKSSLNRIKTRH